ncbi:Lsr2 dimerization domain-containing protein [Propionibacterium freudenreichii]|uniref:Lsr2 dimerization domain-containing protein n=1 Tax=Propionibacterium freudenreichii TaxID=1744 RepID=UPI003D74E047
MARNVKVVLIDDVDGGDADQTINFGLDGVKLRDRPVQRERTEDARRARRLGWPRPPRHRSSRCRRPQAGPVRRREDPRVGPQYSARVISLFSYPPFWFLFFFVFWVFSLFFFFYFFVFFFFGFFFLCFFLFFVFLFCFLCVFGFFFCVFMVVEKITRDALCHSRIFAASTDMPCGRRHRDDR